MAFERTTTSLSFNDTVTAGNAYLYRVHARDAGANPGTDSVSDLAAAVVFTNTLTATVTAVSALDFTEVRTAVNAVERLAAITNTPYTDTTLNNTVPVKKVHIDEPVTRLNAARTQLRANGSGNLANITLSAGSITALVTPIRASDINDLRLGTR